MDSRPKRALRNFDNFPSSLWALPIRYSIVNTTSSTDQSVIRQAMSIWESNTCIRFEPVDNNYSGHYVLFDTSQEGCSSYLGDVSYVITPQTISLGPGCTSRIGTPLHEIGHALGLHHEHERPDRDDYVTVTFDHIDPSKIANFEKEDTSSVTSEDLPYEYGSVMHYPTRAFARNSTVGTITPHDQRQLSAMGQRSELTFLDAKIINRVYCSDNCTTPLPCQNNGYTDPNDCSVCKCPDGLGGTLCDQIADSDPECNISGPLVASDTEQCFSFPSQESGGMKTGTKCNWHIKADETYTIAVNLTRVEDLIITFSGICVEWVEVKDVSEVNGLRFCSSTNEAFISTTNEVLVVLSATYEPQESGEFEVCYKLAADDMMTPDPWSTNGQETQLGLVLLLLSCLSFGHGIGQSLISE